MALKVFWLGLKSLWDMNRVLLLLRYYGGITILIATSKDIFRE